MRNEGFFAAKKLFKICSGTSEPHSSLTLSRTCDVLAVAEVHVLHSFGEHDLVDGTCEREGEEKRKDKSEE